MVSACAILEALAEVDREEHEKVSKLGLDPNMCDGQNIVWLKVLWLRRERDFKMHDEIRIAMQRDPCIQGGMCSSQNSSCEFVILKSTCSRWHRSEKIQPPFFCLRHIGTNFIWRQENEASITQEVREYEVKGRFGDCFTWLKGRISLRLDYIWLAPRVSALSLSYSTRAVPKPRKMQ